VHRENVGFTKYFDKRCEKQNYLHSGMAVTEESS
jgi:hypothetical protein